MTEPTSDTTLSNLLHEERRFDPPPEFAADANVGADVYDWARADRLGYWAAEAERLSWGHKWDEILDWSNPPFAKWFVGGELNVAYNCVDRHVEAGHGAQVAYHWEGEPGDTRTITYADLHAEVCKATNALLELGVSKGDRVAIYMPMIPELPIAMLACARLGAPHTVVFGGFSAEALSGRIHDSEAKLVITADGGNRRGAPHALKPVVDEAVANSPTIENVLVVRRTGQDVEWNDHDVWWHDLVERQSAEHTAEPHDAEHPLY
ncbi:MAG: AMP-binding protein, partial [Nocardioidaceae bacterium]